MKLFYVLDAFFGYLFWLGPILLILLAAWKLQVRRSRLVQIGFWIFLLGLMPMLLFYVFTKDPNPNPVGLGMLFFFLGSIALLLMLVGAIRSLLQGNNDHRSREKP